MWRFEVMRRLIVRGVALLVLAFLLVPAGFSKSPAKSKAKKARKSASVAMTTKSDNGDSSSADANADETATPVAPAAGPSALPAQAPPAARRRQKMSIDPRQNLRPCLRQPAPSGCSPLRRRTRCPAAASHFPRTAINSAACREASQYYKLAWMPRMASQTV